MCLGFASRFMHNARVIGGPIERSLFELLTFPEVGQFSVFKDCWKIESQEYKQNLNLAIAKFNQF